MVFDSGLFTDITISASEFASITSAASLSFTDTVFENINLVNVVNNPFMYTNFFFFGALTIQNLSFRNMKMTK